MKRYGRGHPSRSSAYIYIYNYIYIYVYVYIYIYYIMYTHTHIHLRWWQAMISTPPETQQDCRIESLLMDPQNWYFFHFMSFFCMLNIIYWTIHFVWDQLASTFMNFHQLLLVSAISRTYCMSHICFGPGQYLRVVEDPILGYNGTMTCSIPIQDIIIILFQIAKKW